MTGIDFEGPTHFRPGQIIKADETGELFQLLELRGDGSIRRYRSRASATSPWVTFDNDHPERA